VFLCCASVDVDVDYNEYVQNPVLMIYRQDFVHYSRDEKCLYDSTYQKKEIDTYNYLLDRLFHKKVKAHG